MSLMRYCEIDSSEILLENLEIGDKVLVPTPLYSKTEYGHLMGIPYEYIKIAEVSKITPKKTKIHLEFPDSTTIILSDRDVLYEYSPEIENDVIRIRKKAVMLKFLFEKIGIPKSDSAKSVAFTKLPFEEIQQIHNTVKRVVDNYC